MGSSTEGHRLVLAAAESAATMTALCDALRDRGVDVDVVETLTEARSAFLERGGHELLLLGPDLTPALARELAHSLTEIDPQLAVCIFGELLREEAGRRIGHHPTSRAAIGAVLKVLQEL